MSSFRVLAGLPPYGAAAIPIPPAWGGAAREGLVVEFATDSGDLWVGNFKPGLVGVDDVRQHPNGHDVLVIAAGDAWLVDRNRRTTTQIGVAIDAVWRVSDPDGLVMSCQQLAFMRVGSEGVIWHTRRISWDGFKQLQFSSSQITGLAWAPWSPEGMRFAVDLRTGQVQGGTYNGPEDESDDEPGDR